MPPHLPPYEVPNGAAANSADTARCRRYAVRQKRGTQLLFEFSVRMFLVVLLRTCVLRSICIVILCPSLIVVVFVAFGLVFDVSCLLCLQLIFFVRVSLSLDIYVILRSQSDCFFF